MTNRSLSRLASRFASFSARTGVGVFLVGVAVLLGWLFDIPVLKSLHPNLLSMKANTAVCFALSGVALWLLQTKRVEQRFNRRLAQDCAFVVMAVALLTLLELILHAEFGIDQLLFREAPGAVLTAYPGRMFPITALIFLVLGLAFLLLDVETQRGTRPAQFLILFGSALSLLGFFGYLYEAFVFFGNTFPFVAMAMPTAVTLLALCAGMMAARPDRGLMVLFTSEGPGGVMIRRLLLAVLVLPVAFDLLTMPGEKTGYYDSFTQAAVQGLMVIVAFTVIIYWVSWSLERAKEDLRERDKRFRILVSNLPIGLYRNTPGPEGRLLMANPAIARMFGYGSPEEFMRHSVVETYVDPQERKQFLDLLLSQGHVEGVALRLKKKDGTPFWGSLTSTVIRNASGEVEYFDGLMEDITERKQAEEQLRKLSRAVEQSPASVVITDLHGDIEYVNPKFTNLTGYTLAEAIGKNPRILKSGEQPPEAYRQLWETIATGREWRGEFHNKKKNGDLYWEFASISPITDEAGRITHFLAVKEDITLRKQAEAALRESEERLHLATSAASIGIWDWDMVKDQLVWDDSMYRLYGIRREDFAGAYEAWIRCVHPDDAKMAGDAIQAAIRGEKEYAPEFRILQPDGSIHFIQAASRTFRDKDGKPLRMIGTNIDITEIRQAEAALRESEERFRTVTYTASDAIVTVDNAGRILFWNPAAEAIFGHTAAEAAGQLLDLIIPERFYQAHQRGMDRMLSTDEAKLVGKAVELTGRRKNGQEFPLELSMSRWKTENGSFFTGIIRDISERKKVEAERERLIGELQEALAKVKTLSGLIPICASCKKSAMTKATGARSKPTFPNIRTPSSATAFARSACSNCIRSCTRINPRPLNHLPHPVSREDVEFNAASSFSDSSPTPLSFPSPAGRRQSSA